MKHCSTGSQRAYWVSEMIVGEGVYGTVGQISRKNGVSRQALYTWKAEGKAVLERALSPKEQSTLTSPDWKLERAVLTLFVQGHASYRGIQACLEELWGEQVSLGTIVGIMQEAGQRAQAWMSCQKPVEEDCALALDEQYGGKRGEGYLNVVDAHSSFVWASTPLVKVDGESWTLLLWYLQEQGVALQTAATDGGQAMQEGLRTIKAEEKQQRDVWHVSHVGSQVQGRVDRSLNKLQEQLSTVQRQADRIAQGKKALGANPRSDVQAHETEIKQVEYMASGLSYLRSETRRLLSVVVLGETSKEGLLDSSSRQSELETIVELLMELTHDAPASLVSEIRNFSKHLRLALPNLLLFARRLDQIQGQVVQELGKEALYLIGWAWQRRQQLASSRAELVSGFLPTWQPWIERLFAAWDRAVRASSVVENWHSILRPHLAVHRKLSAGMLALLAVWHNHRVAPRGCHEGLSPIQRSGLQMQTTDWLSALGYTLVLPPPAPGDLVSAKQEKEVLVA